MKRVLCLFALAPMFFTACAKKTATLSGGSGKGAAIVEVSGGKQVGRIGAPLDQPVVVQVNDAQGTAVQGALVVLDIPGGEAQPRSGVTDSSGQFTSTISAPGVSGHFAVIATTAGTTANPVELRLDEISLGYQQTLGRLLSEQYCARCHDPESTPERVSNMDNLDPKPHAFTDGEALNKLSNSDLLLIISRGGPALNRQSSMPGYGNTLSKNEIQALADYIRAIADPPYKAAGTVYASK